MNRQALTHVHIHAFSHADTCAYIRVQGHIYSHAQTDGSRHINMQTQSHKQTRIVIYRRIYSHTINTHKHTDIQTHILLQSERVSYSSIKL